MSGLLCLSCVGEPFKRSVGPLQLELSSIRDHYSFGRSSNVTAKHYLAR